MESIAHGNEEVVGNKVRVKVVKNKVAPPFRKAEMDIMFGKGISAVGSMLEAALQTNIVEKAGSWYSYGKERIGQGVENARLFLESNPAVYAEVEKRVTGFAVRKARRGGRPGQGARGWRSDRPACGRAGTSTARAVTGTGSPSRGD